MITSGLVSAVLFLIMSHSKPLNTLAPARPPPSICCVYMVVDVLGQFAVHMYVLASAMHLARPLVTQVLLYVCVPVCVPTCVASQALGTMFPGFGSVVRNIIMRINK
jgi:hypothetical protein